LWRGVLHGFAGREYSVEPFMEWGHDPAG
jgi:hypothetical protein